MKHFLLFVLSAIIINNCIVAQNLPFYMRFSDDHKRLITGNIESSNVFDESVIHTFDLTFSQSDYLAQLAAGYSAKKDIMATIVIDGKKFDTVGVRYKGMTSYSRSPTGKKSLNITMNGMVKGQDYQGYETFNLNNAYEDPSSLREVNYLSHNRHHIPAARAAFARVTVNKEYWGVYSLVQGLDGEFINEWFLSNDGTRWRAERSSGTGGPGGFGAGTSSINFLGTDTTLYKPHYTLKNTKMENPWKGLMVAAQALNQPALDQMYDTLNKVMDVDRALWFIAHEIMFGDDDGYINKGGMDYYVYFDKETNRLVPLEYDGNSVMSTMAASWSIFNKETDTKFPLSSRLLKTPELRQRYLAHARVMFNEYLEKTKLDAKINTYYNLIDSSVKAETTKRIYTYAQFQTAKTDLINLFNTRRNTYSNNLEFKRVGPSIADVSFSSNDVKDRTPDANQSVTVNTTVTSSSGVKEVKLYYSTGFDGSFKRAIMYDDGMHNDSNAQDGIFGSLIPGFAEGTYVRFYVEATANDGVGTISYMPLGAEHDVYVYRVNVGKSNITDVVINEIMASNATIIADQDGEFDDWIELYNLSSNTIDLGGWSISDNPDNLTKFTFANGTTIAPNGYLSIWADEDGLQSGLHANFKLSAAGENLYLIDKDVKIVDSMSFGQQITDKGFARVPNGLGNFIIQEPTYNKSNDIVLTVKEQNNLEFKVYPNPAKNFIIIGHNGVELKAIDVFNSVGTKIAQYDSIGNGEKIHTDTWAPGMYVIKAGSISKKVMIIK
jgi:spore coat protein CotH